MLALVCAAACVTLPLRWLGDTRVFDGALFLLGLLIDVPVLLTQWCIPNLPEPSRPMARPPEGELSAEALAQWLERDAAQEGADKYTRE